MLVDTTALRHDAHRLRERAGQLRGRAHALPGEAPPSWEGASGDAFAEALRRRRDDLDHAATLHEVAARVLEAHLDVVDAQQAALTALTAGGRLAHGLAAAAVDTAVDTSVDAAVHTAGDAALGVVSGVLSGVAGALR